MWVSPPAPFVHTPVATYLLFQVLGLPFPFPEPSYVHTHIPFITVEATSHLGFLRPRSLYKIIRSKVQFSKGHCLAQKPSELPTMFLVQTTSQPIAWRLPQGPLSTSAMLQPEHLNYCAPKALHFSEMVLSSATERGQNRGWEAPGASERDILQNLLLPSLEQLGLFIQLSRVNYFLEDAPGKLACQITAADRPSHFRLGS